MSMNTRGSKKTKQLKALFDDSRLCVCVRVLECVREREKSCSHASGHVYSACMC